MADLSRPIGELQILAAKGATISGLEALRFSELVSQCLPELLVAYEKQAALRAENASLKTAAARLIASNRADGPDSGHPGPWAYVTEEALEALQALLEVPK